MLEERTVGIPIWYDDDHGLKDPSRPWLNPKVKPYHKKIEDDPLAYYELIIPSSLIDRLIKAIICLVDCERSKNHLVTSYYGCKVIKFFITSENPEYDKYNIVKSRSYSTFLSVSLYIPWFRSIIINNIIIIIIIIHIIITSTYIQDMETAFDIHSSRELIGHFLKWL